MGVFEVSPDEIAKGFDCKACGAFVAPAPYPRCEACGQQHVREFGATDRQKDLN